MRVRELLSGPVAVWGLGREGIEVLQALVKIGREEQTIIVTEDDTSPRSLLEQHGLGGHFLDHFTFFTLSDLLANCPPNLKLVTSPGVSLYRPEVDALRKLQVRFTSLTELWFSEEIPGKKIVVTGTKGKSTTASLIAHLARKAGYQVELAGNIGVPLSFDKQKKDLWVIELSSYQLCAFNENFSGRYPDVALLLNLYPEHQTWHGSCEQYYRDKTELFRRASNHMARIGLPSLLEGLTDKLDLPAFQSYEDDDLFHIEGESICYGKKVIASIHDLHLKGDHFHKNVLAALTTLHRLNMVPNNLAEVLSDFEGLPHRLQEVAESGKIRFVDDSISTIPQTTSFALKAYQGEPIALIIGGADRGQDWKSFFRNLAPDACQAIVVLPGHETRIHSAYSTNENLRPELMHHANSMDQAVQVAIDRLPQGGVVLLSPGAPSYGSYKNYIERGNYFLEAATKHSAELQIAN